MAPAIPVNGAINYDFFSQPIMREILQKVISSQTTFVSPAETYTNQKAGDSGVAAFLELFLNRWEGH